MPISDPVGTRRVLPDALAFPSSGRDNRGSGVVSYQSQVIQTVQVITNITFNKYASEHTATGALIWEAERRAKHHASTFGQTFHWDIASTIVLGFPQSGRIAFAHEVLRAQGARYDNGGLWRHQPPKGDVGVWLYGCHIRLNFVALQKVRACALQFWKNGSLYRTVDEVDVDITGDGADMRDCRLSGVLPIPMNHGDVFDVRLLTIQDAAPGFDIFMHPSSVQGHVWGALQRCDQNAIQPADNGQGYIWI